MTLENISWSIPTKECYLQQQINFNGNIFGNKCCHCNKGSLYLHRLCWVFPICICTVCTNLGLLCSIYYWSLEQHIIQQDMQSGMKCRTYYKSRRVERYWKSIYNQNHYNSLFVLCVSIKWLLQFQYLLTEMLKKAHPLKVDSTSEHYTKNTILTLLHVKLWLWSKCGHFL